MTRSSDAHGAGDGGVVDRAGKAGRPGDGAEVTRRPGRRGDVGDLRHRDLRAARLEDLALRRLGLEKHAADLRPDERAARIGERDLVVGELGAEDSLTLAG